MMFIAAGFISLTDDLFFDSEQFKMEEIVIISKLHKF